MNNESAMDCASRIKLERQKRSWTQEQLAERAKLSARTVQRLECGAEPSPETLRLLAEALGIPVESLRGEKTRNHFSAPWCRLVKFATAGVIAATVLVAALPAKALPLHGGAIIHVVLVVTVLGCLALSVNGYSIKDGRLLVHRLGWATKFDLAALSGMEINPRAMMGSIRLFGNGGLFCFIGLYRNAVLGRYRAYLTDPARSVVLQFGDRKIVVSPDDPTAFLDALRESSKGVCAEGAAAPLS